MSTLERLVLEVEKRLNGRSRVSDHPAWGEDIKVMGIRQGAAVSITLAHPRGCISQRSFAVGCHCQ